MTTRARGHRSVDADAEITWLVLGALVAAALTLSILNEPHPTADPHVPWWSLVIMFTVAESSGVGRVHDHHAITSPMSRIVLVVGLYLSAPVELIVAHAVGNAAAAGTRRWREAPRRVAISVVGVTLSTAAGAWGYLAMTELTAPRGPEGWADGIVAAATAVAVSTALQGLVMRAQERRSVATWVGRTLINDVLAVATGLVAAEILRTDPRAAWLLVLPAAAAYGVHHQYALAEWRADALASLHHLSHRLQQASDRDHAVALALDEARKVCRADHAKAVVRAGGRTLCWWSDRTGAEEAAGQQRRELTRLAASPTTTSIPTPGRAARRVLAHRHLRPQTLVVPVRAGSDIAGYLELHRRRGRPWTNHEVQVAETLAASFGITMATITHLEELADRNRQGARLLAEQQQVATELQRVSDAKSVFLATTSHELRAPLGALLAETELLAHLLPTGDGEVPCRELIRGARDNAEHLLRLVDDLLDLSRIESGRLQLRIVPTDLRVIAEDVVRCLLPVAEGRTRPVAVHGATAATVRGDPGRLRQVITNLLHNAIRATAASGEVHIEVHVDGGLVGLSVVDDGCGIAAEDLDRMFAPFERVRPHDRGLGLGLTIARHLVEAHGGTLSASSTPGVGSRFTVLVPTTGPPPTALPRPVAHPHRRAPVPAQLTARADPGATVGPGVHGAGGTGGAANSGLVTSRGVERIRR